MTKKRFLFGDLVWAALLIAVSLFFILPATHALFLDLTAAYPYGMGFLKFSILASMGELLVVRLKDGRWKRPAGFLFKVIVWGLLGIAITFMFLFFSTGVSAILEPALKGTDRSWEYQLLTAFLTSVLMNLTFGPVFMGLHRITDTTIDLLAQKQPIGKGIVLRSIDWSGFIDFVIFRTIPLWWIPVHTLTFLLPGEYRVLAAAYLSIALGIILVYARGRREKAPPASHS